MTHPWIAGTSQLSSEPLEQSVENLRRFHRGRRRLKALMLAIMCGLANGEPGPEPSQPPTPGSSGGGVASMQHRTTAGGRGGGLSHRRSVVMNDGGGKKPEPSKARKVGGALQPRDSKTVPAELLGSRRAAVAMLDPENKVHI